MTKERETLVSDLSINAVDGFFYIPQKLQIEIRELLTQPDLLDQVARLTVENAMLKMKFYQASEPMTTKKIKKEVLLDSIFNESCIETMKRIPDNFVDVVITSPPYNMNLRIRKGEYCSRQIGKELSTKYEGFSDNLPIDEYNKFHTEVLRELLRISNLVFYNIQIVTGSKRSIFKMIGEFSDQLKEIIVWDKGHGQPAMQEQVLNRRSELILVFENDYPISRQFRSAKFKRGTLEDIWEIKRERKKGVNNHGATYPEELIKTILDNFTDENDVIYDPFLGTGTTAVVSKKLNRRYIGSELIKDYFKICQTQLKNADSILI